jgi:hypothetical protein
LSAQPTAAPANHCPLFPPFIARKSRSLPDIEIERRHNKLEIVLVLKLWNKRIPTDVQKQYSLLEKLHEMGLSVSKPYAWGRNSKGEYILITSYDGKPLPFDNIESGSMKAIANLLVKIHNARICFLEECTPKFDDFVSYFFPGITEHTDITVVLQKILKVIEIRTDRFIHGDYNLGNILVNQGGFTVIDWTNAQLGDSRYDFAWASFLIKIYSGDECYEEFVKTYTDQIFIDFKHIYIFEMMACLRWIWLSRIAPIPKNKDTGNRVKRFIEHHKELQVIAFTG